MRTKRSFVRGIINGIRNLLTAEWASGMRGNGENSASRIFERLQTDGRALIQRARGEFRKYFFRIAQTRDTEISRELHYASTSTLRL